MMVYLKSGFLFLISLSVILMACNGNDKASEENTPIQTGNAMINQLSQKIAADPENAALFYERGQLFYDENGYEEAIVDLSHAIELDSSKAEYYHLLADSYMDFAQSYPALQVMKKAALKFPERIPTLLKLTEYYLILKNYDEALEVIATIIDKDPENAEGYFMGGMVFKEAGDTIRAINSFQNAVEIDPELVDAWVVMGQLYEAIGDPIAIKFFNNAVNVSPENVRALHAKAFYLSNNDKIDEALEIYRTINVIDQNYEESYFNSAILYMDMDSMQKAVDVFDILLKINPIHIQGYYYRGLAKELAGNLTGAKNDFQQALKFAPQYGKAEEGLSRVETALKSQ